VHCTTMWKIKVLPRGKAGTSRETKDQQNIVNMLVLVVF